MLRKRILPRGDTLPFYLVMETDEAGLPWASFADYRISFTVKSSSSDSDDDALITLTSDIGGGISAGTTAIWQISAAQLQPGSAYYYDVQLERLSTGAVITLETGLIVVSPDVTQSTQV